MHVFPIPRPQPLFDANARGGKDLGKLPEWDLTDLYAAPDAPELKRDLDWLEQACASFAADYEGKLGTLDAAGFLDGVHRHERIEAIAGRIMSYAGLRYYQLTTDPERTKFLSDMQEKITNYTTPLVFFTLELNRLEDDFLDGLFAADADLARYKPVFDRIRAMKPYQLSDELEKFLHDLGVVGDAWERLFDETIAGLSFEVDGEELNIEGTLNLLTEQDRAKRRGRRRANWRASSATMSAPLPACTTRRPRRRKSSTAGAACPPRRPRGTCRTTWSPRWSRRCATRWSTPIPASRTATTS